jgi:excisionase family DNA binding protein
MTTGMLSIKEVANQLGVDYKTIYRLVRKGELSAAKIGGVYRIRPEDVNDYIEQQIAVTRREALQHSQDDADDATTSSILRHCEYCLRLIKRDEDIGGHCEHSDCDAPICVSCWQDNRTSCRFHHPDQKTKLANARNSKQAGDVPTLVTTLEAKRREINFRERFVQKTTSQTAISYPGIKHPVPVDSWDELGQFISEEKELSELVGETGHSPTPVKYPGNVRIQYRLPPVKEHAGFLLEARFISRLSRYVRDGFDTHPLAASELLETLLTYTETAEEEKIPVILGLISPTGWDKSAISLIIGDKPGDAWSHRWIHPCLIDLETNRVIAAATDAILHPYLSLFTLPLPEEEISIVESYIHQNIGYQTSIAATEVQTTLNVSSGAVLTAFQRLVTQGDYLLEDVEGIGQVIARF